MQTDELKQYELPLLALRARLAGEMTRISERSAEELFVAGDLHVPTHPADQAAESLDREVAVIAAEKTLIDAVDKALERLKQGKYGVCAECGAEIAAERLDALPCATQCVACAGHAQ